MPNLGGDQDVERGRIHDVCARNAQLSRELAPLFELVSFDGGLELLVGHVGRVRDVVLVGVLEAICAMCCIDRRLPLVVGHVGRAVDALFSQELNFVFLDLGVDRRYQLGIRHLGPARNAKALGGVSVALA